MFSSKNLSSYLSRFNLLPSLSFTVTLSLPWMVLRIFLSANLGQSRHVCPISLQRMHFHVLRSDSTRSFPLIFAEILSRDFSTFLGLPKIFAARPASARLVRFILCVTFLRCLRREDLRRVLLETIYTLLRHNLKATCNR